jgi:Flp pilus assembly pilin Flp
VTNGKQNLKKGGDLQIKKFKKKEVTKINTIVLKIGRKLRLSDERGQSTIEYALVLVIAGIISAVLVAVGKPMIIDLISKVFSKISGFV